MAATATDFVAKAASQIGVKESPANSNNTKYGQWYGMNYEPWCDMFVSWCADQIGALDLVGKYAYCPYHVDYFKKKGWWLDREEKPQPGDLIFFANEGVACHVGIVERRNGTVSVTTIEGNTSTSSNDNGGAVMRRERKYGTVGSKWYILGFGRPKWPEQPASKTGTWVHDSKGWWYKYSDGTWPKNQWLALDAWYLFNEDGYAVCDEWVLDDSCWYAFDKNCRMLTGWQNLGGSWFYMNPANGVMLTRWAFIDGRWYWLGNDGRMVSSTVLQIEGKWYAFDKSGAMYEGHVPTDAKGAIIF